MSLLEHAQCIGFRDVDSLRVVFDISIHLPDESYVIPSLVKVDFLARL
jgi:hypothetical protein